MDSRRFFEYESEAWAQLKASVKKDTTQKRPDIEKAPVNQYSSKYVAATFKCPVVVLYNTRSDTYEHDS